MAAGLAARCEIQLSYGIGLIQPISIDVNTFGTSPYSNQVLVELINQVFDLTPEGIIRELDLKRPIYYQTSFYGHFGRDDLDLPWEKLTKVQAIQRQIKTLI